MRFKRTRLNHLGTGGGFCSAWLLRRTGASPALGVTERLAAAKVGSGVLAVMLPVFAYFLAGYGLFRAR